MIMNDSEKVKKTVARLVKRHKTTNPFQIADALGVLYQIGACKNEGCYMFLKNHRYIFLSDRLQGAELNLVMAHELGHALLDRKENITGYPKELIALRLEKWDT